MFKKLIFIPILLLSILSYSQEIDTGFVFNYLTNDNGLSHNTVYDICQDDKGFLWIATEVGLNRYDGGVIRQYYQSKKETPSSINTNTNTCLVYTRDSILFIGTPEGLMQYLPQTDNFKTILKDGESFGDIVALREGYDEELLISTENQGAYIYQYKTNKLTKLQNTNETIYGICVDEDNTYWAFSRYILFKFNSTGEIIREYKVSPNLFGSALSYIMMDSKNVLWIGTFDNGLFFYNKEEKQFTPLDSDNKLNIYYIRSIEEGQLLGEYWIGSESGLYIINIETDNYKHYTQSFNKELQTINDNAVYKVFKSQQNDFYIGTYFGGVNIFSTYNMGFKVFRPTNDSHSLSGKAISAIRKDKQGRLWFATEDAGITIYNQKEKNFEHLRFSSKNPNSIPSDNVHSLLIDGDICWSGHFLGGLSKIDMLSNQIQRYIHQTGNPESLSDNFVFALHFLTPDSILVGSLSGVDILNKRTEKFSRFRDNEFAGCFVYEIFDAPDNKVWFCTYDRGIFILDKERTGLMMHFQQGDESGLTNNSIISYCIDSKQQIWIGTRGGGLLKYDAERKCFTKIASNLLIDDVIYGILEDDDGLFWVSTNKGISRINFSNSTASHFNVNHGIAGNQHNYKSYYKDKDTLYFGSVKGLTWFVPKEIILPEDAPSVYFTNLRINNEVITPNPENSIKQHIDYLQHIKLRHNQNSFTIDFAAINYYTDDIKYQYYLEGFENNWSPLIDRTHANYTNISPGNYTFHIRALNSINNKISDERCIQITIARPYWASWYAYFLYFTIILGIAIYFYRLNRNRQKEKTALIVEKIEKENLKLLHQHKLNFFTYISHEFKTPLSIILTSVDMLSDKANYIENEIHLSIKRSAERLLSLVNQLMEFRKIESDHASIFPTNGNIISFINQLIETFHPLLHKKQIRLKTHVEFSQTEILFDFEKLEQILSNLITNAITYTPRYGTIVFDFHLEENLMSFSIRDSGAGISTNKKNKIFEAFYSDDTSNDITESSGIGLALTASLVKLLQGNIIVDSQKNIGTCFKVSIPYEASKIVQEQVGTPKVEIRQNKIQRLDNMDDCTQNQHDESGKSHTIVIVEDNQDLLMLLGKHFRKVYHVKCFDNGKDALDYIINKTPDLIITDIMMPRMSGIELCKAVKTNNNLKHIPLIMLTAKNSKEDKFESLKAGADIYISKPFSMDELNIRIENFLNIQTALKGRLKNITGIDGIEIPTNNQDQEFIKKILELISSNIDKNELDVQFITHHLKISRTNLHNKITSLLKISTSELINTIRINKAKELIQEKSELTFIEIAYMVGYNDSAYFSRVFKKFVGKTPKEYRKSIYENA